MRIGELARRAGIGVQTIRYYERMKLLNLPKRMGSGYRKYEFEDFERVMFIRRTQEFGFSLEEIRKLAAAHTGLKSSPPPSVAGASPLQFITGMFENKRREVAAKIAELESLEKQLREGIDKLVNREPQCPVGTTVATGAGCPHLKGPGFRLA